MSTVLDFVFYGGIALYVAAAVVAGLYLWKAEERLLSLANRIALAGAVLLLATFALRTFQWQRLPLTTLSDSLNLFVLLSTAVAMLIVRQENMRPLLSFYLPPVALIAIINAIAAHQYLHTEPRELRGTFLAVHVGLAFLAYALFFVASLTSMGYVFQAHRLKTRNITGLFQRLPSLERLDGLLFHLIGIGYPLFAITMILGLFWAYVDRDLLTARWWLAPKVVMAVAMAAFYSVTFHSRRLGRLRGPKLAYVVFIGFTSLLGIYLALGLTHLNNYNFYNIFGSLPS